MSRHRIPAVATGALTALALVVLSVVPVSAASPTVTIATSVSGTTATVTVDVNRAPHKIASCTYVLDNAPAASCGPATSVGSKAARYTLHLSGQSAGSHTITVSIVLPDRKRASEAATFTVGHKVFALAFTNVDGVAGYQPASGDVLIAKLEDTNDDLVVDVGDTVIMNEYPKHLVPPYDFGSFAVTSHVVSQIVTSSSIEFVVNDAAGRYIFLHDLSLAVDVFEEIGGGGATYFDDALAFVTFGSDTIHVDAYSPSGPDSTGGDDGAIGGDDPFIDVIINP